jgi:hypothetical protein
MFVMFMIGHPGINCCPLLDNFENVTITIFGSSQILPTKIVGSSFIAAIPTIVLTIGAFWQWPAASGAS